MSDLDTANPRLRPRPGAARPGPARGGAVARSGVAAAGAVARPAVARPPIPPVPLRVVGPGEKTAAARRRRARLLVVGTVSVFAAMVFGLVGVHVLLAQNQLRLDKLNARATAEQVRFERLRLQVAQLESPARIVQEAMSRGMVTPPGVTYLSPPPAPPRAGSAQTGAASSGPNAPAASSDWTEVKPELAARP